MKRDRNDNIIAVTVNSNDNYKEIAKCLEELKSKPELVSIYEIKLSKLAMKEPTVSRDIIVQDIQNKLLELRNYDYYKYKMDTLIHFCKKKEEFYKKHADPTLRKLLENVYIDTWSIQCFIEGTMVRKIDNFIDYFVYEDVKFYSHKLRISFNTDLFMDFNVRTSNNTFVKNEIKMSMYGLVADEVDMTQDRPELDQLASEVSLTVTELSELFFFICDTFMFDLQNVLYTIDL